MRFMITASLAVALLAGCTSTPSQRPITSPVSVVLSPGVTALIPAPTGLTSVTTDVSPRAFAAIQALHGEQTTLVAAFMLQTNIDALNNRLPSTEFEYAAVVQPVDPRTHNVPLYAFDHEISLLKKKEAAQDEQMARRANEYNATHAKVLNQGGVPASTQVGIDSRPTVALDIPHAYGSVFTVHSKVGASSVPITIGMAYLLVKGHMVMEGIYKSGNSSSVIEFVRNATSHFALATLRANDEPTK